MRIILDTFNSTPLPWLPVLTDINPFARRNERASEIFWVQCVNHRCARDRMRFDECYTSTIDLDIFQEGLSEQMKMKMFRLTKKDRDVSELSFLSFKLETYKELSQVMWQ